MQASRNYTLLIKKVGIWQANIYREQLVVFKMFPF